MQDARGYSMPSSEKGRIYFLRCDPPALRLYITSRSVDELVYFNQNESATGKLVSKNFWERGAAQSRFRDHYTFLEKLRPPAISESMHK